MSTQETKQWAAGACATILKVSRWSDIHIWSNGGDGYIDPQMGGHVDAEQTHSQVRQRMQVHYRTDAGQERVDDWSYSGLNVQEGMRMFLLWGTHDAAQTGNMAYIENLNTGQAWSNTKPAIKKSGFIQWAFTSILWLALVWPATYYATLFFNHHSADYSGLEQSVQAATLKCPPGKVSALAKPKKYAPGPFCQQGNIQYAQTSGLPVNCRCPSSDQLRTAIRAHLDAGAQAANKIRDIEATISAWLIGSLIALCFGAISLTGTNRGRRKLEMHARQRYLEKLVECAKSHGVALRATNIEHLRLRRQG